MDNNINFDILELAVMYTALKERLEHLQKLSKNDSDIKLKGEIDASKLALNKVKQLFVSQTGKPELLD